MWYIFWEGYIFLQNLPGRFVLCSNGQIYSGDSAKFCDLLRIYELYHICKTFEAPNYRSYTLNIAHLKVFLVLIHKLFWSDCFQYQTVSNYDQNSANSERISKKFQKLSMYSNKNSSSRQLWLLDLLIMPVYKL